MGMIGRIFGTIARWFFIGMLRLLGYEQMDPAIVKEQNERIARAQQEGRELMALIKGRELLEALAQKLRDQGDPSAMVQEEDEYHCGWGCTLALRWDVLPAENLAFSKWKSRKVELHTEQGFLWISAARDKTVTAISRCGILRIDTDTSALHCEHGVYDPKECAWQDHPSLEEMVRDAMKDAVHHADFRDGMINTDLYRKISLMV